MLDGNALAGELAEIFVVEATVARSTCASCGAVRELGALAVYAQGPGTVVRCPGCDAVLLRIVRREGSILLEARGLSCLELDAP
jgi:hypothetical protein